MNESMMYKCSTKYVEKERGASLSLWLEFQIMDTSGFLIISIAIPQFRHWLACMMLTIYVSQSKSVL